MAKRNVSFVDQHIEKVVVGVCALLLLGTLVFTFGGFRFSVSDLNPAKLCDEARNQADLLTQAVRNAQPSESNPGQKDPSEGPEAKINEWFGPSAKRLIQIARIEPQPPRTRSFPSLVSSISKVSPEDRHNLARIVAPSVPIVTAGETTFQMPPKLELEDITASGLEKEDVKPSKRSWVSVGAQVDLVEQDVNFRAEKYPPGSYLTVVRVHLQRKDRTEAWRDWENVDTYLPFKPFKQPQVGESLEDFRWLLDDGSDHVARPKLPDRRTGDRVVLPSVPYLNEPPLIPTPEDSPEALQRLRNRRAREWRDLATKAMEGRTASKIVDLDAALMLARAACASGAVGPEKEKAEQAMEAILRKLPKKQRREELLKPPRAPERLMPILAHDLDATPGHTYQYRMRYEVLNRYAGISGELIDPAAAEQLTALSDWSPPSRPVEVPSDVHFFLTKADRKRGEVAVTIYKRTRTGWKHKDFRVKAGDKIGRNDRRVRTDFATDAVCVDIDFNRVVDNKRTTAMVYLDTNNGLLRERLLSVDRKDKLRKKLD